MAGPLPPPGLVETVLSPSHWDDPQPLPDCWVDRHGYERDFLAADLMHFVDRVEHSLLHDGYERVETHTEGPLPLSDMPIGMSTDRGDANVLCIIEDHYDCYQPRYPSANFTDGRRFAEADQELQQNPFDPEAPIFDLEVARWCSYGLERVTRRPFLAKTVVLGDSGGIVASVLPEFALGEHKMDRPQRIVRIGSHDLQIGATYQRPSVDNSVSLTKIVQVDVFAPVNKRGKQVL